MIEHIEAEDLASLALLLLSEEETATVETHLRTCGTCRAEYSQIRADLGVYAYSVEPASVPTGARERFLQSLSMTPQVASGRASSDAFASAPASQAGSVGGPVLVKSERSGGSRVLHWIGWAAAAAAVLVAFGLKQDRDALRSELTTENAQTATLQAEVQHAQQIVGSLTDPTSVHVSLTVPKAPSLPTARATYQPKGGTLLMLASNLAPLPSQKVYELWVIPANGGAPIPAGTFTPDSHGGASVLIPALHGAVAAKALGITIEPAGGSATPTMPIVLAGAPA